MPVHIHLYFQQNIFQFIQNFITCLCKKLVFSSLFYIRKLTLMQKLVPSLLVLSLGLLGLAPIHAQTWKGQVLKAYESQKSIPVPAVIINQTQKKQTFSEKDGYFKLKAKIGDSIRIKLIEEKDIDLGYRFSIGWGNSHPVRDTSFIWNGEAIFNFPHRLPELFEDGIAFKALSDQAPKIKANSFSPGNRYNPYQLIQGKIPGVVISRPGGDPNYDYQVQIRGLHSAIYTGFAYFPTATGYNQQFNLTQPLVEVDGMPGWSLNSIDPQDIASIEVLKDAASLAAYGMRGANGVIKIQTKCGAPYTRSIEYSTYVAMDIAAKPDRGIDVATYRSLIKGEFQGVNRDLEANNDWYKLISRTGFSQAHNLAVQGTALGSNYRLALNFREVNGIAKKSGFDQMNALLNFQKAIQKRKGNISGLFAINQRKNSEVNPDVFRTAALMNPTAPIFSDTSVLSGSYYQPNVFGLTNPLSILNWQTLENTYQTLTSGLKAEFHILPKVNGEIQVGFQKNLDTKGWAYSERTFGGYGGFSSWEKRELNHLYFKAQLSKTWFRKLITKVGYSHQRWDGRGVLREGISTSENLISYRPLIDVQGKPAFLDRDDPYRESDDLAAFYAHAQYNLGKRWLIQGAWRREGFTRLGDIKWENYPAIKVSGKLLSNGKIIEELRVHAGYGVTGNIPPKNHATELLVLPINDPVYVNGEYKPGIYYPFVPNPDLQAEQRRELNIGFNLELLNSRMQVYIDLYKSHSANLLWQYSTSDPALFSNVYFENRMEVSNQGVEVQLHLTAIRNNELTWQSNLNLAHNRTKLESPFPASVLGATSDIYYVGYPGSPGFCCSNLQRLENQQPIGEFFAFRSEGIDANGQWKIRDLNGDGNIDEVNDRTKVGNAQPKLTFGWDNVLKWKNFTANIFWRGALGHRLLNVFNLFYASPQRLKEFQGHSIPEVALNPEFSRLRSSNSYISDYYVQNASFIRLENLSLAYDFTKNPQKEHNLQLYISAQNLFTLSSFSGNDPEVRLSNVGAPLVPGIVNPNYFGNNSNLNFIDRGRYPLTRTLTLGAKLKL